MLPFVWVSCAAVIVASAIVCRRRPRALVVARAAMATLFIGAGAAVNAFFLLRGDDYSEFADGSYVAFVRDTWRSLVVPNHDVFISVLIAFELAVGILVLLGGRSTRVAYVAAIGFHIALLSFGWGFYLWSIPMLVALVTLLLAEGRSQARAVGEPEPLRSPTLKAA
jgi:hypothetical protein